VNRPFARLHARAFCHATEDLDKVKTALQNTVGEADILTSRTEGHHGNPITIVETSVVTMEEISRFFERLGKDDLRVVLDTLPSRVDDGCNLFIKIDKQAAYEGCIRMGHNENVISVRVKVQAFPGTCEVAQTTARAFMENLLFKGKP
jgi:RNA binding exosome subunit